MSIILKIENISKQYRLGLVGTGSLGHDLNRFLHRVRGKEDPYLKVGAVSDRSAKATEDYVWALRDINFEVEEGEVLGIIGKNGAGKSTLLKLLSRVTSPTTGIIKSRGRIASLLEVGTGFHPELTGRENIYLNGAILGMTRAEIASKIDEIIDFSGCELYIDTPTKRYSSGMTVRLAFAVAAHLEPDILVIDEVLAVGDAEFQKKAIGKMQEISSGEGRTVLFVSHNMNSVKTLCTRAMYIENGSILASGDTDEMVKLYLGEDNILSEVKPIKFNNDDVELDEIILLNDNNEQKAYFDYTEEVNVNISGRGLLNDLNYDITLQLTDNNFKVILSTSTVHLASLKIRDKGEFSRTMIIPREFLNEGDFYLNIILVKDLKKIIFRKENAQYFKVLPIAKKPGMNMGRSKGVLRPKLIWK
jgi:homopolymeric O-antigen transport system ATP-binding protein